MSRESKAASWKLGLALSVSLAGVAGMASSGFAQDVLPRPEPPFKGIIGQTYKDSRPDKIALTKAPEGAPNQALASTGNRP